MTVSETPSPAPDTPTPDSARVFKRPFRGSLGERDLYIYLPPGYHDPGAEAIRYPVLYLHDGQNCFGAFLEDAFSGSWYADESAERLIRAGEMRPCIVVGVSHGGAARLAEYLPPYSRYKAAKPHRYSYGLRRKRLRSRPGRAHETFAFYEEVAGYIGASFRVLRGREHTATCGSSMGGLFSAYIALEHPEFARHHGVLSASFWATASRGAPQMFTRLRGSPVHDLRLWLDSGEGEGDSDDNKEVTLRALQALLDAGYQERKAHHQGGGFTYHLAAGATHSEAAWAARLPQVLSYLFPPEGDSPTQAVPETAGGGV